jgi:hypothetical protein
MREGQELPLVVTDDTWVVGIGTWVVGIEYTMNHKSC